MVDEIQEIIEQKLGPTAIRGRDDGSPRKILVYKLKDGEEPLKKDRVVFEDNRGMVEFLGNGQHYVIEGKHPKGGSYTNTLLDTEIAEVYAVEIENVIKAIKANFGTVVQGSSKPLSPNRTRKTKASRVYSETGKRSVETMKRVIKRWEPDTGRWDAIRDCIWGGVKDRGKKFSLLDAEAFMSLVPERKRDDTWNRYYDEIPNLVRGAVEKIEGKKAEKERAQSNDLDNCDDPLALLDALYALTDDDVKNIGEEKWVYKDLLAEGHILVLVGMSGSGKTALFVHLAPEFVKAGYEVRYINLDAPYIEYKRLKVLANEGGYLLYHPDIKGGGKSIESMMDFIDQISRIDVDLRNKVFIFDTLKKFIDMMVKKDQSEFFKLLRRLTAKGATIVLLGHTNKKRESGSGNLVFEGCGDIRSDTDELLYLEFMDDSDGNRLVSTYVDSDYGAKVRGSFQPITFLVDKDRSVKKQLIYTDVRKSSIDKEKVNKHPDIKQFIVDFIKSHEGCTQSILLDACREAGLPNKPSREMLKCQLANVDSNQYCLYEVKDKINHPYPMQYYTLEYYEAEVFMKADKNDK